MKTVLIDGTVSEEFYWSKTNREALLFKTATLRKKVYGVAGVSRRGMK